MTVPVDAPGLEPPPARPEPKRDRYERYLIPDPVTGEERPWTRATTWAGTVADRFRLERWALRMCALGLAKRPDLTVAVAAVLEPHSQDGKKKLDALVKRAQEVAAADARARIGSALHSFAEAHDSGREIEVPAPFDRDLEAYQRAMRGVHVSRNYIEQICVLRELGVAGTMDRVVRFQHGPPPGGAVPMIGDLKTGSELSYSWTEIAIQLALYAHADTIYNPVTGKHHRMIAVDQEKALVVHLPAGEGRCQLYLVDIMAGWEMAQVCGAVRRWRARDDLAELLVDWSPK